MLFKTPREVALEKRVAILEQMVRYAELHGVNFGFHDGLYDLLPDQPQIKELVTDSLGLLPNHVTLPLRAEGRISRDAIRFGYECKLRSKDGLTIGYYLDDETLLSAADTTALLAHMHEEIIKNLSKLVDHNGNKVR